MTKRKFKILSVFLLPALLFIASCRLAAGDERKGAGTAHTADSTPVSAARSQVSVEAFDINGGWGYSISVDGQTHIYQPVIPSLPGNKVFNSKEDALRVGNAVADKLKRQEIPALSREELVALHIKEAME